MKKILVNALPMTVVGTGIGRYLRGLYSAIEKEFSDQFEVGYFIGNRVVKNFPSAKKPGWKESLASILWRMPYPVALGARLLNHFPAERNFFVSSKGYDIYHEAAYFPFKAADNISTIFTIHDLSLLRFPQWHPRERVEFSKLFFRRRLKFADEFCAVSEFTKREMIEFLHIAPELITVTPLGFDGEIFNTVSDASADEFLALSGVPSDFILFVGSGDPRKNLDLAVAAVQDSECGLPLVTVGWTGWEHSPRSNVFEMGYVSDRVLAQLYRRAAMLLMPSEYEGFGLPVLEAMACGCPVVISNAEALLEVTGKAAVFVKNVYDLDEFSYCIDTLASSKERRNTLVLSGLARSEFYNWSTTAKVMLGRL